MSGRVRTAEKAGSWYSKDGGRLRDELNNWLEASNRVTNQPKANGVSHQQATVKALISPHAGYVYCGATAAFAYSQIDASLVDRVFILGPSHRKYLDDCAVTQFHSCATPVGDLKVDTNTVKELLATGRFSTMSASVDEAEHSIEMQLPFLAHVLAGHLDRVQIVPILVGALKEDKERLYGQLLAPYLAAPRTIFLISSDFCHWGKRFSYTPYDSSEGLPMHMWIEKLDKEGMRAAESLQLSTFSKYMHATKNTICGRHPIAVLIAAAEELKARHVNGTSVKLEFVHYSQSSSVANMNDSSVSYAAGVFTFSK